MKVAIPSVDELKKYLEKDTEIVLAVLFGSHAKGTADQSSDIDLAVAMDRPMTVEQKADLSIAISSHFDREVDLVDLLTATGTVLQQALTTGIVVLNRSDERYHSVVSRMIRDEEDFQRRRRALNKDWRAKVFHGKS